MFSWSQEEWQNTANPRTRTEYPHIALHMQVLPKAGSGLHAHISRMRCHMCGITTSCGRLNLLYM